MYMAHSVEARAPFLDVEVVELCLAVATEELIEHGIRKHPLRAAMRGRVPEAILGSRRKIGFASPMRAEFGSPVMHETVKALFADPRSEAYLDPQRFLREYSALSPSQAINDFFANAVTLELWMREFDVTAE
jgi:asparagine synthase (glutamine-hydrolysing)